MGRGQGRGGAQLGKQWKGKNQGSSSKGDKIIAAGEDKQLTSDVKQLQEYEKIIKLAEAQKERLKRIQQREMEFTKANRALLLNLKRQIMRREKTARLRQEIDILAQQQERDFSRKDGVVQMLIEELTESENQLQTAQRAHMQEIDRLVALHQRRIARLEEEFERDLLALKREFGGEANEIMRAHTKDVREIQAISDAVEQEERERVEDAKQAHETEREEIRNKNLEDINMLRISLENKIEDLERQFDEAHQTYVEHTHTANETFKSLLKNDSRYIRKIKRQEKRIERLQAKVASWKKTIAQTERECQSRNAALQKQNQTVSSHCSELKNKLARFRSVQSRRLKDLTVLSRAALLKNEANLEEVSRLLKLAEQSRKYETEREKVRPFYQSSVEEKEEVDSDQEHQRVEEFLVSLDLPSKEDWGQLENFTKKFNKALLDKLSVEEEKARLEKENKDLRKLVQQYIEGASIQLLLCEEGTGVSVSADTLDRANPLLIVNRRVNVSQGEDRVRHGLHVTEGAQVVRSYARHART